MVRRNPDSGYSFTKTVIQIGAYVRKGYKADGTIVWLDFPNASKAAKASVSTFVIGHLAIQVVTGAKGHLAGNATIRPGDEQPVLTKPRRQP